MTAWFVKAADYMKKNEKVETSFVSTNSICQGEQVNIVWGLLQEKGISINFAYTSFPWTNDATDKAGVACIIIGYSYLERHDKSLFNYNPIDKNTYPSRCSFISPYLCNSNNKPVIVKSATNALSSKVNLVRGPQPTDGGNLIFDYKEGRKFLEENPTAKKFVKKFIGSSELIKGDFRYCLWLTPNDKEEWSKIESIMNKVNKCREWREKQKITGDAFKLREKPWSFRSQFNPESALLIPAVSSENRQYIPMNFIKNDTIVSNLAFILPNATHYDFAILTSRIHMCWMRLTCGRLGTGYRYSRDLTFNTFIWPEVTEEQKEHITNLAKNIRRVRARNAPMT